MGRQEVISSRREQQVIEFQRKFESPEPVRIAEAPAGQASNDHLLTSCARTIQSLERELGANFAEDRSDVRMIRAKLIVSETAEVLEALRDRDEVALADGLADLEYVTIGTATAYEIPLGDVFDEVHRSNMTKSTVGEAVKNHSGDKGKGADYSPPDVAGAIARGRDRQWIYSRGDRLATRDGRVIGNATVTVVEESDCVPLSYEILTDYGNTIKVKPADIRLMFYAEPIGKLKNLDP